ncbi:MAG: flagellar protein FliS [Flavobacteriales bacterium]|jgi:flagellar protein FliS
MSVEATQAAIELENATEISPHRLISLLMQGVLERVEQAKTSIDQSNQDDLDIILPKIVNMISALRQSLDFDQGGDLALNLDGLYEYMIDRVSDEPQDLNTDTFSEIAGLMDSVKDGWDQISSVAA